MNGKKYAASILGVISLLLITSGVTLAFFNYAKNGQTENSITTDGITFVYNEESKIGRGILIEDAMPMTDEQGKTQTNQKFDFRIVSKPGNTKIKYTVTARKISSGDTLDSLIDLYLTDQASSDPEVFLDKTAFNSLDSYKNSTVEKVLYEKVIDKNDTVNGEYNQEFRLRMWLDSSADFSDGTLNNKEFKIIVNVNAVNYTETSENNQVQTTPMIVLNKLNNNTNINLQVNDTFTDPGVLEVKDDKDTLTPNDVTTTIEYFDGTNTTTVSSVDTTKAGVYYINYTVTDSNSNTTTITRVVTVNTTSALPTIALVGDDSITAYQYTTFTDPGVTVDTNNRVVTIGEVNTNTQGTYQIKYVVIDQNGNMNSIVRSVEIMKNEPAAPVLTDNLVPVLISDNGTVTKANIENEWYNYANKEWANAVVLVDKTQNYENGATIPESNIQSYFVWIPRYRYKIFNTGNYTELEARTSAEQIIDVVFEDKNTPVSNGTEIGDYLTHPAFTAFDVNGIWVGKFETGNKRITSVASAEGASGSSSDIIVKPNVYFWRGITVGNIFSLSYNYLRDDDSHMMKNTEWGAVAYLQHSKFGSHTTVRVNNNANLVTGYAATIEPTLGNYSSSINGNRYENISPGASGTYTKPYNTSAGYTATTTGNITGIYDMSGGGFEYVAGYISGNYGKSEFTPTDYDDKYFDVYNESSDLTTFQYRILGDATGEMGPFYLEADPDNVQRQKNSWHHSYAYFIKSDSPWFIRGGSFYTGNGAGLFTFRIDTGTSTADRSFRLVLAPNE